jgi:hypothetical protein
MSIQDKIQARIKVVAYKPEKNPDNRTDLCGEPFQKDEDGREFAVIPAHCKEQHAKLFPTYEFSEEFEVDAGGAIPKKAGRPRK